MLNLNNLKTPGVYIDEVPVLPKSVVAVPTAIPAFIGYTQNGPTEPTRISSFEEYVNTFGGPYGSDSSGNFQLDITLNESTTEQVDDSDPANPVTTYDPTGNIELVASAPHTPKHNMYYSLQLFFNNGGGSCYIVSAGGYSGTVDSGSDFATAIGLLEKIDEVTLIVVPEVYQLTTTNLNTVVQAGVSQAADLQDRFVLIDVPQANGVVQTDVVDEFQANANIGDTPQYAAAYYPLLETTIDLDVNSITDKINLNHNLLKPDGSLVDTGGDGDLHGQKLEDVSQDLLKKQLTQQIQNISLILPSSPAMAGIYARVDNDRGVWKAPANVAVASVVAPTVKITDKEQENMNIHPDGGKSVNAIRTFTGRGTVVWGARTLDGNDNEWRYISVRRFFNFVEESVKKATYDFVFEPNDANTWNSIKAMIENFLTIQWNLGALQGSKADQAFFVRVGLGETMTALDILEGRLIVEIGMAVVRPAEFIILRFMHKLPEA